MSLMGQSLPIHSALASINVRYAPNSDQKWCNAANDAKCQQRTTHRSKQHRYSIISSARERSVWPAVSPEFDRLMDGNLPRFI